MSTPACALTLPSAIDESPPTHHLTLDFDVADLTLPADAFDDTGWCRLNGTCSDALGQALSELSDHLPALPPQEFNAIKLKFQGRVSWRVDRDGAWMQATQEGATIRRRLSQAMQDKMESAAENQTLKAQLAEAQRKVNDVYADCRAEVADVERRLEWEGKDKQQLRRRNKCDRRLRTQAEDTIGELESTVDTLESEVDALQEKLKAANLRVYEADKAARASSRKLLVHDRSSTVQQQSMAEQKQAVEEQLKAVQQMYASLQEMRQADAAAASAAAAAASADATAAATSTAAASQAREEALLHQVSKLKTACGLDPRYKKVPDVTFQGDASLPSAQAGWSKSVSKHVHAAVDGRLQSEEGAEAVARALSREGKEAVRRLFNTRQLAHLQKEIAQETLDAVAEHWTARHAVHVWDRLDLSDSKMETLRHLLSFVYDHQADTYSPIKIWVNPHDEDDYLVMTKLASRPARKKEFNSIADECSIVVAADGHCQRDAVAMVDQMYTRFSGAMRTNFSAERPAQPVLFLDATGASLGRGITHVESGSADFAGNAKQSRSTLCPLALYEGSDKAVPLREHLDLVLPSWNRLIAKGTITRNGASIPAQPITSADMQGTKALYGQSSTSQPTWCKCRKGPDQQHKYPKEEVSDYKELCRVCEEDVGCEIKQGDEMCRAAHYSPGVWRGGAFTEFECPCCGYKPTEAQWRKELAEHAAKTDAEQKAACDAHLENGVDAPEWMRHWYQLLFVPPAVHHGMDRAGVDMLHLIDLNIFKALFKYTIHESLPGEPPPLLPLYHPSAIPLLSPPARFRFAHIQQPPKRSLCATT